MANINPKTSNNTVNVIEPEGNEKVRGEKKTTRLLGTNLDYYLWKTRKMSCQSHRSRSSGSESTTP